VEAARGLLAEIRLPNTVAVPLVAQFVAMHFAGMDCLKQAIAAYQVPEVRNTRLRHAG
jgi:hypothetical protein